MGIIGHRVEGPGLRFIDEIKTYGELLEEIENTKIAIQQVKDGFFYEQGDEFDLELHLISLKKIKIKNEKDYRIKQEIGIYTCDNCDSGKLNITSEFNIPNRTYEYQVECVECGHTTTKYCREWELRDIIFKVEEEFEDELSEIWRI